jgi:hypothetical protein
MPHSLNHIPVQYLCDMSPLANIAWCITIYHYMVTTFKLKIQVSRMLCHVRFIALHMSKDCSIFISRTSQPQQPRVLDPADEGVTVLRNARSYNPSRTPDHPTRPEPSAMAL